MLSFPQALLPLLLSNVLVLASVPFYPWPSPQIHAWETLVWDGGPFGVLSGIANLQRNNQSVIGAEWLRIVGYSA
jgi:hypothetical protein